MAETPSNEPQILRAGDTWKWRREDLAADYPAPAWTLKYRFKNAAGGFELTAAADGQYQSVTVAAATTGAYAAGVYAWQAWVESGAEKYTVDTGTLEVLADLRAGTATAALDTRSHARKMLALVESALEALNLGVKSYTINGRSMTRRDLPELIVMRDKYKAEVAAEEAADAINNGLGGGGRLLVRG